MTGICSAPQGFAGRNGSAMFRTRISQSETGSGVTATNNTRGTARRMTGICSAIKCFAGRNGSAMLRTRILLRKTGSPHPQIRRMTGICSAIRCFAQQNGSAMFRTRISQSETGSGVTATNNTRGTARVPLVLLERMTGIEPAQSAWEAEILPLNYIRGCCFLTLGRV